MKMTLQKITYLLGFCWMFLLPALAFATGSDSLKKAEKEREVRNYIRPTLSFSFFATGARPIKGNVPVLNNRLGDYQFKQSSLSFYAPLYTRTRFTGTDSTHVNTFHLLFTLNALTDRPEFSGLEKQHKLYKVGIGLRTIWTFKSKFIMFADVTPIATGDKYDKQSTARTRLGATLVFNYMHNPNFSVRLGVTKNFLFGNRFVMPMVGFRIGRLDGPVYFQFQFPRHTSLTIQPSPKFAINIYSRSYGGLYNLSNEDSLYIGNDSVIQFGHFGMANGVRLDFRPNPNFNFFLSGGFATRNYMWLYSYSFNRQNNNLNPLAPFYKGRPDGTLFLQAGITWRFGKAKRSTGNYLMYDAFDLNNTMDPGDNNNNPGNGNITPEMKKKQEMEKVQYKDVEDLVDEADLY